MSQYYTNRLARETSPYLLQHAHNPVDWYPWGDEALGRARSEGKPILLSVGYSACHWCHVMERECFENEGIARLMNEHFVCIKVDREERPDIDHVYMEAVQTMTGGGGWPLTVFLTPSGEPFYGGTYFPPEDRHGLPGFPRLLMEVSEAYRTKQSQVEGMARNLVFRLKQTTNAESGAQSLTNEVLTRAYRALEDDFDNKNGGFGPGPKFPQAPVLEFLLQYHHRTGESRALQMVEQTLDRMAAGGIYDHIGGGFHRYATDASWMTPHFEKMLYDNALLGLLYLHAYQVTGRTAYRRIVEETLDYILREMTAPAGGFYSSQDADVDGEEGRYYLWTPGEISGLLGEEDGRLVSRYFGIGSVGKFESGNVLHIPKGLKEFAAGHGLRSAEIEAVVARSKLKMLEARDGRPKPDRDDKILTSWNGLMMHGLAEAAGAFGRADYLKAATANANFIISEMMKSGVLMHSHRDGVSVVPGYLDDYASVIRGLLCLYETTFGQAWLQAAFDLAGALVRRFGDSGKPGVLYDTGPDHGQLFIRPRDTADSVKPCGGSSAANVLLRISRVTGEGSYEKLVTDMLSLLRDQILAHPLASGNWLCSLDLHLSAPDEVVIVGRRDNPDTEALLRTIYGLYLPNRVLAGVRPNGPVSPLTAALAGSRQQLGGHPTAYVCRRRICYQPVTDADQLRRLMQG